MAYNQLNVDRTRIILRDKDIIFHEKKMFGGLAFMVDDKMCICASREELMCRMAPDEVARTLESGIGRPMIHNQKPYRDFIYIDEPNFRSDAQLSHWIDLCLDFNKVAKSSKK